ncbi:HlyD family secretion protein [Humitalea sp. 24SJ18S-53]|uniref:HlyD family secretion protein n=1 Tax=Humitalea sp. 24SJ18S-53 TaxID=3422307 RepID=UPI003D67CDB9
MLTWIETHVARSVLIVAALLLAIYQVSALVLAYSGDARMVGALVAVAPEVAGPIDSIPVRAGQEIAAGATLLTITQRPFALALATAQAGYDVAEQNRQLAALAVAEATAVVAQTRATLTDAEAVLRRQQELAASGDAPRQRVDDATRDADVGRGAMLRAEAAAAVADRLVTVRAAEVAAAAAARDQASYNLSRTTLTAPIAGRVAPFTARPGDNLAQGVPVLLLVTDADWRVIANVAERHMARLTPGQTVWVTLGNQPWRPHRGVVRSIATAVTSTPDGVTAGVIPYVPLDTDWIRLPQRFPVEIVLPDLPADASRFHGATARVLVFF